MEARIEDELAVTGTDARQMIAQRLGDRLDPLRVLDRRRRLEEIGVFGLVWLAGAAVAIFAGTALEGAARLAVGAAGVGVAAVGLNAFVLLLHEGMHRTLFANSGWNRRISVVLGGAALISFTAYRVMHLRHHRYLGDPRDPDDYHNYTRSPRVVWLMHYLRLLVGCYIYLFAIPALAWRHGSARERRHIAHEYAALFLTYGAAFAILPRTILVWGWLLPILVVAYLTAIRGFTQHSLTDADDPFLASRSVEAHPIVAYCLLYENYHLEHHLFPEVPSYHLPALHAMVWPELPRAVTGRSYLAFVARFLRASLTGDEAPIGRVELGDV